MVVGELDEARQRAGELVALPHRLVCNKARNILRVHRIPLASIAATVMPQWRLGHGNVHQ